MAQRYQIQFDSFDGLNTVITAIDGFCPERFISSLHLRTRRIQEIAALDSQVLHAIGCLQDQHTALAEFAQYFNDQFVTRNNHYFNSAHQLLRKIHTGTKQVKSLFKQFTPNSSAAVSAVLPKSYEAPSIFSRSALGTEAYTQPLFPLDTYPPEVQRLYEDMDRFFKLLRDSLLLCVEVLRQERFIRQDPQLCQELYHNFKDERYQTIKKFIFSISIQAKEFTAYCNPAVDLRQSSRSEQEFSQRGFHNLEYDDVCTLAAKELVEEAMRGEYTVEELALFPDDYTKIHRVRYIISHFDDYLPGDFTHQKLPAAYVACLLCWCNPKEDLAFVRYFQQTYTQAGGKYLTPSNPAVNQAKFTKWASNPVFTSIIQQWDNVEFD